MLSSVIIVYVFIVRQLSGAHTNGDEARKDITVCEHSSLELECPAGLVLDILQASYGRTDNTTCLQGPVYTVQCHAHNSLRVIQANCQEKQTCTVKASNSVFGDPCVSTFKYLNIQYACQPGLEKGHLVCEGETLKMECKEDEGLDIRAANYGRSSAEICKRGPILTHSCSADRSLGIARAKCQNESVCSIKADNIVFGDPCVGTYKYLELNYVCTKIKGGSMRSIACERDTLRLDCSARNGTRIAVNEANYGREDGGTCFLGPIKTYSCITHNALEIVKAKCEGKKICEVKARNSVFGDPCVGTFKYLDVHYECIEGNEIPTEEKDENAVSPATKHPEFYIDTSTVGCEGEAVTLDCGIEGKVHIVDANYGRTELGVCTHGPILVTDCYSDRGIEIVQKICENSTACTIEVKNGVFGDPCRNTYKYLNVTFQCIPISSASDIPGETGTGQRATGCENDSIELECSSGTLSVTTADYGRTDNVTCLRGPVRTTNCSSSQTTLPVIKNQCDGKKFCSIVVNNDEFGDPCFNTYKYLTVEYHCLSELDSTDITACQDERMGLICDEGEVLKIDRANYGRSSRENRSLGPILTNSCHNTAINTLAVVKDRCEGKGECALTADDELGNPCPGTYKCLTVSYQCVQLHESAQ